MLLISNFITVYEAVEVFVILLSMRHNNQGKIFTGILHKLRLSYILFYDILDKILPKRPTWH